MVALRQLVALGLSPRAVRDRVEAAKLHRIHRGVYAVGRADITKQGHYMAAVLACGAGALLSHWAAADHQGLWQSNRGRIDITVPGRARRARPNLTLHCPRNLDPADTTTVDKVACTTWARTALDIAAGSPARVVERLLDRAEDLRIYDGRALAALLQRNPTHRGSARLRSVITALTEPALTKNDFEETLLLICDDADIPRPLVNQWIQLDDGGPALEADFMWPREKLIAEADGYATHGTRTAFESDREKDMRLALAGWLVVRFTWRQIHDAPTLIASRLGTLLANRRVAVR